MVILLISYYRYIDNELAICVIPWTKRCDLYGFIWLSIFCMLAWSWPNHTTYQTKL